FQELTIEICHLLMNLRPVLLRGVHAIRDLLPILNVVCVMHGGEGEEAPRQGAEPYGEPHRLARPLEGDFIRGYRRPVSGMLRVFFAVAHAVLWAIRDMF